MYYLRYHHIKLFNEIQTYAFFGEYKETLSKDNIVLYGFKSFVKMFWLVKNAKSMHIRYTTSTDFICKNCIFVDICSKEDWITLKQRYEALLGVEVSLNSVNLKLRDEKIRSSIDK